jgi:diguanylate cyclase (GGDEF)-like protein/PAS domain S-box-containing protein
MVPVVLAVAVLEGFSIQHGIADSTPVVLAAALVVMLHQGRAARSITAAIGLLSACAALVHLTGGLIEMHFLFFVMVGVITLYQDWLPFLVAIGFVALHHGIGGVIDPHSVYNHADAWKHPWEWAGIHASFILAMSVVSIVAWKLNEDLHGVIRVSEERFRGHFEHAAVGEAMTTLDGRFVEANQALCEMLGYSETELHELDLHAITHPDDQERTAIQVQRLLAGEVMSYDIEKRYLRSDGTSIHCLVSASMIRDDHGHPRYLTAVLQDISERKGAEAALEHQALHDALTGLPNRTLLVDRVTQAIGRSQRSQQFTGILFLDLDRFKLVNDSLGYTAGDEVLLTVASRLGEASRSTDTVARFGGDEFVVLCEDLKSEAAAITAAQRILDAFLNPFTSRGRHIPVSVSVGVAVARPGSLLSADTLLSNANVAMYRAKDLGRNRYEVFDNTMRGRALEHLETESELRDALERRELVVHYQPIVNIAHRTVDGVEALVRWNHPTRGLVPPGEFIAIAEEANLIGRLGSYVLDEACRSIGSWNAHHPQHPLSVAVNLSTRQLSATTLPDLVQGILTDSGLAPSCLCLEITESALLEDMAVNNSCLDILKSFGISIGVDDFGTGYSSLLYLKRFPVDVLKIDMSFIKGLGVNDQDTAIVGAVIGLARGLGLHTVAEGVERPEQLVALAALRCDAAQGYLWTPALPEAELWQWLEAHHRVASEPWSSEAEPVTPR